MSRPRHPAPRPSAPTRSARPARAPAAALIALAAFAAPLPLVMTSCERAAPERAADPSEAPRREITRGPVSVITRVDPPAVRVGDRVTLTVDVTAETGVDVQMPRVGDALGAFEVRSARTPPDVPDGDRRRWTHEYALSTFEAGDVEIPALAIAFADRRGDEVIEGEIAIDAVTVAVQSVLEEDAAAVPAIKPEVEVPVRGPGPRRILTLTAIVVAAAALVIAALVVVRRRRVLAAAAAPPIPPHEWARRELDRLAGDHLPERGLVQDHYFRLSGIVREYIERRFDLMAPERTTEEFLREAKGHPALPDRHRDPLADFLRRSDLVKFARHEPPRAECESALAAARSFVEETAPRPEADDAPPAGESAPRAEAAA